MTAAVSKRSNSNSNSRQAPSRARNSGRKTTSRQVTVVRPEILRPKLRVLDSAQIRSRARRRNVAIAMFVVLIVGFFAVAFAQAQLVSGQRDLDVLRSQISEAKAERARLERAVEESSAPSAIIGRAEEFGMVRSVDPVYLTPVSNAREIEPITLATPEAEIETPDESILASAVVYSGALAQNAATVADQAVVPSVASVAGSRVVVGVSTG